MTQDERDRKEAEEFVNLIANNIYDALDQADIKYNDEMVCNLLSDGYLAGLHAERARSKGLVEALERLSEYVGDYAQLVIEKALADYQSESEG